MLEQNEPCLDDDENTARCVIYPVVISNPEVANALDHRQLFKFHPSNGKRKQLSLAQRAVLEATDEVHQYGCRTAESGNIRLASEGRLDPRSRRSYIGFYGLSVGRIKGLSNLVYDLFVEAAPENGEDAHAHLTMAEREGLGKNVHKSAYRTEIIDGLWRACVGPERHLCECDFDRKECLEGIELPVREGS